MCALQTRSCQCGGAALQLPCHSTNVVPNDSEVCAERPLNSHSNNPPRCDCLPDQAKQPSVPQSLAPSALGRLEVITCCCRQGTCQAAWRADPAPSQGRTPSWRRSAACGQLRCPQCHSRQSPRSGCCQSHGASATPSPESQPRCVPPPTLRRLPWTPASTSFFCCTEWAPVDTGRHTMCTGVRGIDVCSTELPSGTSSLSPIEMLKQSFVS